MKPNQRKLIRLIDKMNEDELVKMIEEAKDRHERFWVCRGIVNSNRYKNTMLGDKAKSYLDKYEQSYDFYPPMVNKVYCLCLLGDYEKNKKLIDKHHHIILHSEGFCALWAADDENKFGNSSNIGRYTFMLNFDTWEHCISCGEQLEKAGVDPDEMALSPTPMKLKKEIPIYYYKGRFTY